MDLGIAEDPGKVLVDLEDDQVGGLNELLLDHQAGGKGHVATVVGGRGGAPEDVEVLAGGMQLAGGGGVEVVGDVGRATLWVDLAVGAP